MKTPQGSRGRTRRRGKSEAKTQELAAAMAARLAGTGNRGAGPGHLSTAAAGDRLAANRRRASRVRTGDSWSGDGSARRGRGAVRSGGSLIPQLGRVITRDALFDIGADTVGLLVPGGSIAV